MVVCTFGCGIQNRQRYSARREFAPRYIGIIDQPPEFREAVLVFSKHLPARSRYALLATYRQKFDSGLRPSLRMTSGGLCKVDILGFLRTSLKPALGHQGDSDRTRIMAFGSVASRPCLRQVVVQPLKERRIPGGDVCYLKLFKNF